MSEDVFYPTYRAEAFDLEQDDIDEALWLNAE